MTDRIFESDKEKPSNKAGVSPDIESMGEQYRDSISYFIFVNSPIGFFRSTPAKDSNFVFVNPAMAIMLGYKSPSDIQSILIKEIYADPADRDSFIQKLIKQELVEREHIKFRKKNGEVFWASVTARVVRDDSSKARYIDGAVQDITESKTYMQRLMEEKNFSDSVIEALPGCFWLNDKEGRPVRWNKNVEVLYGYSREELKKIKSLKDITTPETLNDLLEAASNVSNGGTGYCEYDSVTKYGKKISFAGDSRLVTIKNKEYLACVEIDITRRKQIEEELKNALVEIQRLKEHIEAENIYLLNEIQEQSEHEEVIGQSEIFKKVLSTVQKVATTDTTALILGETGTGKGVLAQLIHNLSPRHDRPLIKVNCANLPSTLIESILFGHEKGAFTDATNTRVGRFEMANDSSIFLDEIAELPIELQAKLLRVIEDGEFERLGGATTMNVDTRIIAATNRNLEEMVAEGRFRQDLLFRLNVYPITCPPLRDRDEDVSLLTHFFVTKFNKRFGKSVNKISSKNMQELENHSWPGNIRELQNVIERAMVNSEGKNLELYNFSALSSRTDKVNTPVKTMVEVECDHLLAMLEKADWVVEGQKGAAALLGMNPSTLRGRLRKYGIYRQNIVPKY